MLKFKLGCYSSHCMRVKHPVTFRMAPKKSTKGKEVEAKPTRDEGWLPSKYSESDLQSLVGEGLLPSRSVVQWRPTLGHMGEIVAFVPYFERKFGIPCSNYFFWTSVLLRNPVASSSPQLRPPYFHLRTSVRSFSGYRTPF